LIRENHPLDFVSDIAIFVLTRDVKLQPTNHPLESSLLDSTEDERQRSELQITKCNSCFSIEANEEETEE